MNVRASAATFTLGEVEPPAAPFLKWAGGKRQLLPALRKFYPPAFRGYIEPFIGSAAVLFDLFAHGRLAGRPITIADQNADLIGCYKAIRDDVEAVIQALRQLERGHRADPRTHYYHVRDQRFNPQRVSLASTSDRIEDAYAPELAAMLIYLNRTGFNGLFRMNSVGAFNVPAGRYANPRICDAENLRKVATILRTSDVQFVRGGFEESVRAARRGDFVYLDPPYAPMSRTAAFTSYTADGFSYDDQRQLQKVIIDLARRGCWVLLSNSTAPEIEELYVRDQRARRAGLVAHTVPARRAINSNASRRGEVLEFVITNIG